MEEAKRQTLVGVLYDALHVLPKQEKPPTNVLLQWHVCADFVARRNRVVDDAVIWTSERFLKAGFRNVILKGQGNALFYPHPEHRTSGDIDVWLEGDRKDILSYVLGMFPKQRVQWLEVEFPVRKDVVIEVHTAPSLLFSPFDNWRLQRFYTMHKNECFGHHVEIGEGATCVPTMEVNLVFQLTHIYRHLFFEGIGLRQLMDYYYLLQAEEAESCRGVVREMVGKLHMMKFCAALMWVMQSVFCLENSRLIVQPDEREGRFLLDEIMLAGNFGHYDSRNKIARDAWGNFWQITRRNMRFLKHYPREVLWNPPFRIAQFLWRKWNGYK